MAGGGPSQENSEEYFKQLKEEKMREAAAERRGRGQAGSNGRRLSVYLKGQADEGARATAGKNAAEADEGFC